ncbi:MAG TPA: M48 family metallopeptidase [Verrucomicrobiae bacterium]|nr:M48 family metallopeptidase [Verrucomicrobiae bacterium]
MRYLVWILISFAFLNHAGWAEVPGSPAPPPAFAVSVSANRAAVAVAEDVPVTVPAPDEKTVRLYQTGNVWWCVRMVWGLAVPALFLFSGLSARLRNLARRIGRRWYFIIGCYFIMLALLNYGLSWPLDYYQGFARPHAYGLSEQSFGKWFGDSLKELGILIVLGTMILWVPYWLLKKSPRRWWLYAALAMVPFYFFVQLIRPVVVEPMFNQFTPVENKVLEAKILALAERAGIHGSRVYEVKKSVDTKTANAYVTGFLGTKRIVLWDTILKKMDERELLFVMGHEMGHYALGHVVKGILFLSALTLAAFYGVHRTAHFLINRGRGRFGFDELSDIASLPLMALLINVFSLLLTPVGFAYSRHLEHEADRFGLELTHYNHSAASGFVRLQNENLGMPRPGIFYTIWRATHPSIGERIDFFNCYKPWERGEPSKYGQYFQPEGGKTTY